MLPFTGLGAELFGEVEELVRADGIVLGTPPQLVLTLTGRLLRGPMPSRQWYFVGKAAAGPAHQRHL